MIQRRPVGVDPPTSSCHTTAASASANANANHNNDAGATSATTARNPRSRRGGKNTGGSKSKRWSSSKGYFGRSSSKNSGFVMDDDLIITLIQVIGIAVIFGCFVILSLHFCSETVVGAIRGGSYDDDDGNSGWFAGRGFSNHLHKDHENSLHGHGHKGNNNQLTPSPGNPEDLYRSQSGRWFAPLKPSDIYVVPGSMPHIGDKSDSYAALRKEYDAMDLPKVEQRYKFQTMPMEQHEDESKPHPAPYDIRNCPDHPPEHYPYAWNMLRLLDHWPPDDVSIPDDVTIFQGICVFDFETEYEKALNYRRAEVPFVVSNDPEVQQTAKRWMSPGYLERMHGDVKHRCEYSETNHFMYWNAGGFGKIKKRKMERNLNSEGANSGHSDGRGVEVDLAHWQQPTTMMRMKYSEWLTHADPTKSQPVGTHDPHYYFRLIGCGEQSPTGDCDKGSSEYLFDELTFLQPKENLYMVDPAQQKGIHCRFGMAGVIAENHFDQSRNAIALMGGERRYILSHPEQCPLLSLLPKGHPSARHSAVDWSDPDLEKYPEFAEAEGNEVVLQAGDVLYLPTNWFHFIVSLNLNFQCNSRSGTTPEYFPPIRKCGF